jgi:cysteine dioxygenase type I
VVLLAPAHPHPTTLLSPARLLRIARDLAADRDVWRERVDHRPDERWFERVVLAHDHDVWLIGWNSFQGVDLHDHGQAAGVLCVVDGELLETSTTRAPGPLVERTLTAGTARAFGVDHVHRVVNPSARPATSLHVYSPPLAGMDFYRPGDARRLERTHTESALAPRPGRGELR